MATNLRLDPVRARRLARAARETGRSQAQLIREALDAYLGDERLTARHRRNALIEAGELIPADLPYEDIRPYLVLPDGTSSVELLDRDDRL